MVKRKVCKTLFAEPAAAVCDSCCEKMCTVQPQIHFLSVYSFHGDIFSNNKPEMHFVCIQNHKQTPKKEQRILMVVHQRGYTFNSKQK